MADEYWYIREGQDVVIRSFILLTNIFYLLLFCVQKLVYPLSTSLQEKVGLHSLVISSITSSHLFKCSNKLKVAKDKSIDLSYLFKGVVLSSHRLRWMGKIGNLLKMKNWQRWVGYELQDHILSPDLCHTSTDSSNCVAKCNKTRHPQSKRGAPSSGVPRFITVIPIFDAESKSAWIPNSLFPLKGRG